MGPDSRTVIARSPARLVDDPDKIFSSADLIVKVKEPVPEEYDGF